MISHEGTERRRSPYRFFIYGVSNMMAEPLPCAQYASPDLSDFSASASAAWIVTSSVEAAWRVRSLLGEASYTYRVMSASSVRRVASGKGPPALLVVANLPGSGDIERVVSHLASRWPVTPIIVVSGGGDDQLIARSLRAGADDWLSSQSPADLVRARLDAIRRRVDRGDQETQLEVGDLTLDRRRRRIWRGDVALAITNREFALLDALVRGNGFPVARSDLFAWIWGSGHAEMPTENALEFYVSYLRRKLHSQRVDILTVRGVGYRLVVRASATLSN